MQPPAGTEPNAYPAPQRDAGLPTNGHPVPSRAGGRRRRPDGDVAPPTPPARPGGRRRRAEPDVPANADLPTEINRPDGNLLDTPAPAGGSPDAGDFGGRLGPAEDDGHRGPTPADRDAHARPAADAHVRRDTAAAARRDTDIAAAARRAADAEASTRRDAEAGARRHADASPRRDTDVRRGAGVAAVLGGGVLGGAAGRADGRTHPAEAPTEFLAPATEVIPRVRPDLDRPTERIAPEADPGAAEATALIPPVPAPAPPRPAEDDKDEDPADRADDYDDRDDRDDYEDDFDEDEREDDPGEKPRPKASRAATAIKAAGEAMVTLGVVVLLFVVYEVWITDLISAGKQSDVTSALDDQWNTPGADDPERQQRFEFAEGEGMAKLYIPALGEDYKFTVVEGTTEADLEIGPGHYKNSALPGQPGNFAVAGHRVGKGAPFNDLDLLEACDAIVVETQSSWFVYRMLPTDADARTWAQTKATDPRCAGKDGGAKVEPLGGEYVEATGRQIVTPQQSDVVAPVPGKVDSTLPKAERLKLITLTTCHPKFSNAQRMILQGVMVREQPKTADHTVVPVELGETS